MRRLKDIFYLYRQFEKTAFSELVENSINGSAKFSKKYPSFHEI
jgi:hypothetical protein